MGTSKRRQLHLQQNTVHDPDTLTKGHLNKYMIRQSLIIYFYHLGHEFALQFLQYFNKCGSKLIPVMLCLQSMETEKDPVS